MRRDDDPDKPSPGTALPDLSDFDLYLISIDGEGNKDHRLFVPPDDIAAEGHISDFRSDEFTNLQSCTPKNGICNNRPDYFLSIIHNGRNPFPFTSGVNIGNDLPK